MKKGGHRSEQCHMTHQTTFIIQVNDQKTTSSVNSAASNNGVAGRDTYVASLVRNTPTTEAVTNDRRLKVRSIGQRQLHYSKVMEIDFAENANNNNKAETYNNNNNRWLAIDRAVGNKLVAKRGVKNRKREIAEDKKDTILRNVDPILQNLANCLHENPDGSACGVGTACHGKCNDSKLLDALANVIDSALWLAMKPLSDANHASSNWTNDAADIGANIGSQNPGSGSSSTGEHSSYTLNNVLEDVLKQIRNAKSNPYGKQPNNGKHEYFIQVAKLPEEALQDEDYIPARSIYRQTTTRKN